MEKCPNNVNELWNVLKEEWNKTPSDFVKKLNKSVEKRIKEVINNKNAPTKC